MIILWLIHKFLKQVHWLHSFEKLTSLMRHNLASIHRQILMARRLSSILPKMQECKLKICTVHLHDFFAPKLDLHLPILGRICCIPEKFARKNALKLPRSLRLHALTSPDRILGLFMLRAMCMEHIRLCFHKTLAALACPWIMPISPNFWRSHSRRFARKTTAWLTIHKASQCF